MSPRGGGQRSPRSLRSPARIRTAPDPGSPRRGSKGSACTLTFDAVVAGSGSTESDRMVVRRGLTRKAKSVSQAHVPPELPGSGFDRMRSAPAELADLGTDVPDDGMADSPSILNRPAMGFAQRQVRYQRRRNLSQWASAEPDLDRWADRGSPRSSEPASPANPPLAATWDRASDSLGGDARPRRASEPIRSIRPAGQAERPEEWPAEASRSSFRRKRPSWSGYPVLPPVTPTGGGPQDLPCVGIARVRSYEDYPRDACRACGSRRGPDADDADGCPKCGVRRTGGTWSTAPH